MAINLTTEPYWDDFDETKGFHQILFKPGVAVQARELTQMQSIIRNQIKKFGDNVFKNGSLILGGDQTFDKQYYGLKLDSSANTSVLNLIDHDIYGTESGVLARVINATQSNEAGDPPTLFVKYLNSGRGGSNVRFTSEEAVVNEDRSIRVISAAEAVNSMGDAYIITSGVIYWNGNFVYFNDQTAILSKYRQTGSIIVGFDVEESIVTSTDDNTLLDPANGSYNYAAPGADRLAINLTLTTRPWQNDEIVDPNFVEIARIQAGEVIYSKKSTDYNILGDTMARRTYDESGNYTVRPYNIKLIEHLRSSLSTLDGYYTASEGGDESKFMAKFSSGKAYVKGYEIDSLKNSVISADKARDFDTVENGTVFMPFGNYVFVTGLGGIPENINDDLPSVDLYDRFTTTPGTPAGANVGTARIRFIEYYSGTVGSSTSVYKVFLFDIQMSPGYSFTNDVKMIHHNNSVYAYDFGANIVGVYSSLTGTISFTSGSGSISGSGTRFNTELSVDDYININGLDYLVTAISNDYSITVSPTLPATLSGQKYNIVRAKLNDTDKNSYIFPIPADIIKTVDTNGVDTIYSTRRIYERTLTAGVAQISTGVNESFAGFSPDNYQMIASTGFVVDLNGTTTFSGANTILTIDVSGLGYTNETVQLIATIAKSSSSADKKNKSLNENSTLTITTEAASSNVISLGKADIWRLVSVKMNAGSFATPVQELGVNTYTIDITDRYILDNGQKPTYYGLGSLRLKQGFTAPVAPIQITFDYFSHGNGDYFSVDSYSDIDYKDIPTLILGGNEYVLRDCLDFRPRINDAGTGFSGTGSSLGEFPDYENDIITTYEYYLPRTDKVVLNREGKIKIIKGKSEYNPKEPNTPEDSMALYVMKQQAYVFDITKDIELIAVDNKRYTMKDIGKLENRIKNLEYYTTLNQLEVDTQNYQIKDIDGFDRFKNGFVVDAFRGHGIGDVYNPDYGCAIDFKKQELRPLSDSHLVKLLEVNQTNTNRRLDGYVLTGDLYTLPYTEERFIANDKSSKAINLNPYNVVSFKGIMRGKQSDVWFDTVRLPDIYRNVEGSYDCVISGAQAKGTFGAVWGNWETLHYGGYQEIVRTGVQYTVSEQIDVSTNNDTLVSQSAIPKMRDVAIDFRGEGLMPDSRVWVFFNNINVTSDCRLTSQYNELINEDLPSTQFDMLGTIGTMLVTNGDGVIEGVFNYTSSKYNLNTGTYVIRITDDPNNNPEMEFTSCSMTFNSSGTLRNIANEIVSTRNAYIDEKVISDRQISYTSAGKVADTRCDGYKLQEKYYDGAGNIGPWITVDALNVPICGFQAPSNPTAGTLLNTFCDNVTGNLMGVYADGSGGTTTSVKEAQGCIIGPKDGSGNGGGGQNGCKADGEEAYQYCKGGTVPTMIYYDGTWNGMTETCGTYEQAIPGLTTAEINRLCPDTIVYPAKGTYIDNKCLQPNFVKINIYADGKGGTYEITQGAFHADCGYVEPANLPVTATEAEIREAEAGDPTDAPEVGRHLRYECYGYDYVQVTADGNWGEIVTTVEANSEYYCAAPRLDDIYIKSVNSKIGDLDSDGDLDPPMAVTPDTIGYLQGIFVYAAGRLPTASERAEMEAFAASQGLTVDVLNQVQNDQNGIVPNGGGIEGATPITGANAASDLVQSVTRQVVNAIVARGIGEDNPSSAISWVIEHGVEDVSVIGSLIANQAVNGISSINNGDGQIDGTWGGEALRDLIANGAV